MSFAREVKAEIATSQKDGCCLEYELRGIIDFGCSVEISARGLSVVLQTTNSTVAKRFVTLMKKTCSNAVELITKRESNLAKRLIYIVKIVNARELVDKFSMFEFSTEIPKDKCCIKSYLSGSFLVVGSVNEPSKGYHLEFFSNDDVKIKYLQTLLKKLRISAKITERRSGKVLYIKSVEVIEELIGIMGANNSYMDFADVRIERDFKNNITRMINCEVSNERKAMEAANKQLEYINILKTKHVSLSDGILYAMQLRIDNPEASLIELADISLEVHGIKVSKSTLNHRFRAIKQKALDLTKE